MQYHLVASDTATTLTVILEDGPHMVPSSHANYRRLRDYLIDGGDEPDRVRQMLDTAAWTADRLAMLSTRVTYSDGTLFYDGEPLDNALSRQIVRLIRAGDSGFSALVAFLENLALNPSRLSRVHLFSWIEGRDLTITEDGMILAYKGVQDDDLNSSCFRGVEPVLVNDERHIGHIPNPIGAVVRMERALVAPGRNTPCSVGLHVGTHEYAQSFGRCLLHVAVNPRDVVAVPRDCNAQKMRVSQYRVLGAEERRVSAPVIDESIYDDEGEDDDLEDDDWAESDDFGYGTRCDRVFARA